MKTWSFMLLGLGLSLLIAGCSEKASKSAQQGAASIQSAQSLKVGNVDVGAELTSTMDDLKRTLSGITNVDSAKQAIPQIDQQGNRLNSLRDLIDKLPAQAKPMVSQMIQNGLGSLQPLVDKVMNIPGVRPLLEDKLNRILGELRELAA